MRTIKFPMPPDIARMMNRSGAIAEDLYIVLIFDDGVVKDEEVTPVRFPPGIVTDSAPN